MSLDAVAAIVPQTFLAKLPPALTSKVLESGRPLSVPAGRLLRHNPKSPGVAIVLDGVVRVFLRSPADRQVTVRYARPGETLGLVHLLGGEPEVHSQAVTAVALWLLPRRRLRAFAEQSCPLALAIAEECAARVKDAVDELALASFGTVRQQVARHLLDLATGGADGLVAHVTQQELADATGSVREVVARVLRELEALGLTRRAERSGRGIVIVDAAKLDAEVHFARTS